MSGSDGICGRVAGQWKCVSQRGHAGKCVMTEHRDGTVSCTRPPEGWSCSRGDVHDGPCAASPVTAQSVDGTTAQDVLVAHQRYDIGRCLCGWDKLGKSHAEHQVEMLTDAGLLATAQSPAGQTGPAGQNDGTMVSFLTEDERRFFAYMAEQRFRTVVEKDPELRERTRARWQQVALWFDPMKKE